MDDLIKTPDNSLDIPQADGEDVAHIALSTILGLIPFTGAGELFKFMVTPSLEKRREQWMLTVAEAIKELQSRKGFSIDDLRDNEEFITLLIQATQAATKTHLRSKQLLLKNALIAATSSSVNFDSKQLYLGLVDRFSPSHIALLSSINRIKQHTVRLASADKLYKKLSETGDPITLTVDETAFLAFLEDLHQAGLLVVSDNFIISDGDVEQVSVRTTHSGSNTLPRLNLTNLGSKFLHFIDAQQLL
ncbi:MAG: hypothetical protein ACRYF0_07865 [Janthinobacterium lividum]